jgi:hypothetical protein
MIATETVKTVVLVLFGLCILWIIIIVVKNDMQTIVRALLVTAVMGLALYFLNQTKLEKLSYSAVKNELSPVKKQIYKFEMVEGRIAGNPTTTYAFQDPSPPLPLALMNGGKYMAIKDVRWVNNVLEFLGLPPVAEGVSELASITHQTLDADKYRWDNYEKGVLILERGLCRNMTTASTYPCIVRITITSR